MAETSLIDVFLSYAEPDGAIAMRVYEDLMRARLSVWRYEKDGRIGVDFVREYEDRIRRCRYFCLLDSENARASGHVERECELALRLQQSEGRPGLVICRPGPTGSEPEGWRARELFEGQNTISYIDLADYPTAIKRLCAHLGAVYSPGFKLPRGQDLEREVFDAGLSLEQIDLLLGMYQNFLHVYGADSGVAAAQLRVLVERCKRLGARGIISAWLALGVLQAETGRFVEARDTFAQLLPEHDHDPRVWAALGAVQSALAEHSDALASYRRSRELLGGADSRDPHAAEAAHNIARALLTMGRPDEALAELEELPREARDEPFLRAVRGKVLLALGRAREAVDDLERAHEAYRAKKGMDIALPLDLADAYRQIGEPGAERELLEATVRASDSEPEVLRRLAGLRLGDDDLQAAVDCLSKAVELAPESVVYRAELALMLRRSGRNEDSRRAAWRSLSPARQSAQERYYRGLAFFLLDIEQAAMQELAESRRSPIVAQWPDYRRLLDS